MPTIDRYTSVIKSFFVALFFASIYPGGLVLASLACLTFYWTKKWLTLRATAIPSKLNYALARAAHASMLASVVIAAAITKTIHAAWPFTFGRRHAGTGEVVTVVPTAMLTSSATSILMPPPPTATSMKALLTNLLAFFTVHVEDWHEPAVQRSVVLLGWLTLTLAAATVVVLFGAGVYRAFMRLFTGAYVKPADTFDTSRTSNQRYRSLKCQHFIPCDSVASTMATHLEPPRPPAWFRAEPAVLARLTGGATGGGGRSSVGDDTLGGLPLAQRRKLLHIVAVFDPQETDAVGGVQRKGRDATKEAEEDEDENKDEDGLEEKTAEKWTTDPGKAGSAVVSARRMRAAFQATFFATLVVAFALAVRELEAVGFEFGLSSDALQRVFHGSVAGA